MLSAKLISSVLTIVRVPLTVKLPSTTKLLTSKSFVPMLIGQATVNAAPDDVFKLLVTSITTSPLSSICPVAVVNSMSALLVAVN